MAEPSSPPVESLSERAVQEAITFVEIEGSVAQDPELCRYWLDDDNLVYSATLQITIDGKQIMLFRENISGVDLIRDCEEALATGTLTVQGTQGTLDDLDGKRRQYINVTEWAPACPEWILRCPGARPGLTDFLLRPRLVNQPEIPNFYRKLLGIKQARGRNIFRPLEVMGLGDS